MGRREVRIPRRITAILTDTTSTSNDIRPLRALAVGAGFAALLGFWGPYNALVLRGPETTTDFTNAAAVFLLFFIGLIATVGIGYRRRKHAA